MSDEEEINNEWKEYWLMFGGVSEKATEAVESVGGRVVRVTPSQKFAPTIPPIYGVCLLYEDNDDDQGFVWHTDDGKKARELFVCSADAQHTLYIHCADGSTPQFESDVAELRLITDGEWFDIADGEPESEGNS